jgi:transcriptional regulator GlxA family with amidase domain
MYSYDKPHIICCVQIGSIEFAEQLKKHGFGIDRRALEAIQRIAEWHSKRHPVDRVVQILRISPSHMRSLLRQALGISPGRYLRTVRLCMAAQLLETSFLSVKEVASQVGYGDVSHFVRDFKLKYGDTPTGYRQKGCRTAP